MRKPVLILLVVLLVALVATSIGLFQKLQHKSREFTALQTDAQTTAGRYAAAINEISAIQDSLGAISVGEDGAQALATQLQAEKTLSQDQGDQVRERIAVIKAGVERAKARIKDLDAKLQKSGVRIAGLEKMVQGLRKSVAEREAVITQLTQRVGELETKVTGLTAEVETGRQTIEAQTTELELSRQAVEAKRRELGTVYYTIGSKGDLKKAGVIASTGGLLGIGRTLKPTGGGDDSLFTPLDTDRESVIRIPATKARVLTAQPPASYELRPAGEQTELHILDARAFRTVKRVIILTS